MKKQRADQFFETAETRVVDREAAMHFSHEWHLPKWITPSLADYEPLPEYLAEDRCRNKNPYVKWATTELSHAANSIITLLALKAQKTDAEAAQILARLAKRATEFLNEACVSKPELVRPLARRVRDWPVIKRKIGKLTNEEKQLFRSIQLSGDDFVENDAQAAKWQFDDAGRIAYSLIVFIRNARNCAADSMINRGSDGMVRRENIVLGLVQWHRRGARSRIRQVAKEKLKTDLSKDNCEEWWRFAEVEVLLRTYPNLLEVPELDSLVSKTNDKGDKQLYASTRKQKILRKIKSRFKSFARNSSFDM